MWTLRWWRGDFSILFNHCLYFSFVMAGDLYVNSALMTRWFFHFIESLFVFQLCYGRGFVCELCDDDEVIFPFDSAAAECPKCSTVFHRNCWTKKNHQCPKCVRIEKRASLHRDSTSSEENPSSWNCFSMCLLVIISINQVSVGWINMVPLSFSTPTDHIRIIGIDLHNFGSD